MSAMMPSAALLPTDKIQARHRERQAVVYVRQSTVRQVLQHRESTRLQYALSDRARQLGWSQDQVVIIDDDLGRSAASTLHRPGFQRLVAEVGLGHVGLVLGIEVSRLARSCRDWHQLLEMCALFDTLIADADGVYDAANFNDRLLLGLKGTMSEAELHILKARMHEGRRAKAARAELVIGLPRGFVLRPSGDVALDPDEQVRATIQLVFDVFERRRSVYGVLRYLVDHDIQLPDRVRGGPAKGEVHWNRPNQATISDMLRHPTYAGAYVYGRRRMERRCQLPGKPHSGRRFIRAPEQWAVGYHNNGREARYLCWQMATTFGGPRCQSVSAQPVDEAVADLILAALAPSAIEVSLQLAEDIERERAAQQRHWAQRLERVHYETTLARRRYEAVDPENRLVARTLEREWEAALAAEQALRREHERELARQPARLQAAEIEVIRRLAEDVPALWHAPTTTATDRQMIARLMLEQVAVHVEDNSEHVALTCDWAGSVQTHHTFIRPVQRFEQLRGFDQILGTIRALRQQGCSAGIIAAQLNAAGWRPPKRTAFEASMVQRLIFRHKLSQGRPIWTNNVQREVGVEWTLHEAAARLGVHRHTAYQWVRQGRIPGRLTTRGDQCIWLVQMTKAELDQLRQSNEGRRHPYRNPA